MMISPAQLVLFTIYILTNHALLLKSIHQAHDLQSETQSELTFPLKLCRVYQLEKHLDFGV